MLPRCDKLLSGTGAAAQQARTACAAVTSRAPVGRGHAGPPRLLRRGRRTEGCRALAVAFCTLHAAEPSG